MSSTVISSTLSFLPSLSASEQAAHTTCVTPCPRHSGDEAVVQKCAWSVLPPGLDAASRPTPCDARRATPTRRPNSSPTVRKGSRPDRAGARGAPRPRAAVLPPTWRQMPAPSRRHRARARPPPPPQPSRGCQPRLCRRPRSVSARGPGAAGRSWPTPRGRAGAGGVRRLSTAGAPARSGTGAAAIRASD